MCFGEDPFTCQCETENKNGLGVSNFFFIGRSQVNWNFVQVGYPLATSHFAATPQNDVVRICAHDFQRHADAFGTTENACFRAFITFRSQFHLHHRSQRALTEIVSKITLNLGLVL